MQKKIVAAICAAALALALPLAAFAAGSSDANLEAAEGASQATVTLKDSVKSGNVTLSNIKITGAADYVEHVGVSAAGTSASVPANAIAGSVAVFKVEGWKANWSEKVINSTNSFGTFYNQLKADVKFAEAVTAELPSSVAINNLYVAGRYYSNIGGQVANINATSLDLAGAVRNDSVTAGPASYHTANGVITVDGLGTGELVIWMQNGKYAAGDVNNTKDLEASAADSSKSPKTGELR